MCTSFALRDDANTGTAGYDCLESVMEGELPGVDCCVGWETDLLAATPFVLVPAFFAAFVRWLALVSRSGQPSYRRVACRDDGLCRAFRGSSWACRFVARFLSAWFRRIGGFFLTWLFMRTLSIHGGYLGFHSRFSARLFGLPPGCLCLVKVVGLSLRRFRGFGYL